MRCAGLKAAQHALAQSRVQVVASLSTRELLDLQAEHREALECVSKELFDRECEAEVAVKHPDYVCPLHSRAKDKDSGSTPGPLMSDPVVAADGHTYERVNIQRWVRENGPRVKSPKTGEQLASTEVWGLGFRHRKANSKPRPLIEGLQPQNWLADAGHVKH